MQPRRGNRRQKVELRPVPPLRYERLSDPILAKRAKDGDGQALAALCERHAPRTERLAAHLLADSEDARDAAQAALFAEIVESDGIPVGTAKCYAHRGRSSLRGRLAAG